MAVIRKPLVPPESEVCARLAASRRAKNVSQEELAVELQLTRSQLANIETGRTMLNFQTGWKACKLLDADQYYVATGDEPTRPFHAVNLSDLNVEIHPTDSFRRACLGPLMLELQIRRGDARQLHATFQPDTLVSSYRRSITNIVRTIITQTPADIRPSVLEALAGVLAEFQPRSKSSKTVLTETESTGRTIDVKPILPNLLARLRKATEEPGKKSELAKFLDAPLASVSRWLSPDPKVQREPGGEIALKMLHWVEAQERKQ
jgi:transcriptional regulator with XRE-family HTH domain